MCFVLGLLDWGKEMYGVVVKFGLIIDVFVGNFLVVMYSDCGDVNDVVMVFMGILKKSIVLWNLIIVGCV